MTPNRLTPQPDRLILVNGQPEIIALKYKRGKLIESTGNYLVTLTDGRKAFFKPFVMEEIEKLGLGDKERFSITTWGPHDYEVKRAEHRAPLTAEARQRREEQGSQETRGRAENPNHTFNPPLNGQGEDVACILQNCYRDAVGVALWAVEHARAKGLMVSPTFEDIRCIAATIVISSTGGRR